MSDYPLDQDYLLNTLETGSVAQAAVNLAVAVLKHPSMPVTGPLADQALDILLKYADWEQIKLPKYFKRQLMIRNYGEKEAYAILVEQYPLSQWFSVEDIAGKDDRELYKYLCKLEDAKHVRGDGGMLISSMIGERFVWEKKG